jgi:hypothetical protein
MYFVPPVPPVCGYELKIMRTKQMLSKLRMRDVPRKSDSVAA